MAQASGIDWKIEKLAKKVSDSIRSSTFSSGGRSSSDSAIVWIFRIRLQ